MCRVCVQIIVANPKTAGVARWIFLALWGSKMKKGDAAAIEYITKVRHGWIGSKGEDKSCLFTGACTGLLECVGRQLQSKLRRSMLHQHAASRKVGLECFILISSPLSWHCASSHK